MKFSLRSAVGLVGVLIVVNILVVYSWTARFVFKIFTDVFAPGESDAKVYLVSIFLLVLGFVAVIARWRQSSSETPRRPSLRLLIISTLCLAAINIGSYAFFVTKYDLPATQIHQAIAGTSLSVTKFYHIHTLKPVLLFPLSLAGKSQLSQADDGFPYSLLLPSWYYILAALLLLAMLLAIIRYWYIGLQSGLFSLWHFPLYSVASFIILKWSVDGGPINIDFWLIPILTVLWTLGSTRQRRILEVGSFLAGTLCATIAFALFVIYTNFHLVVGGSSIFEDACLLLFLFSMLAFIADPLEKSWRWWAIAFIVLEFLCCSAASFTGGNFLYLFRTAPAGSQEFVLDSPDRSAAIIAAGGIPAGSEGRLMRYLITSPSNHLINDDLQKMGLTADRYPIDINGLSCMVTAPSVPYIFTMTAVQSTPTPVVGTTSSAFIAESVVTPLGISAGYPRYRVFIETNGCVPDPMLVITNHLQQDGFETFILSSQLNTN